MTPFFIFVEWLASASEAAGFLMLVHTLADGRFPKRRQILYCGLISGLIAVGVVLLNLFQLRINVPTVLYGIIAYGLGAAILYKGKGMDLCLLAIGYITGTMLLDAVYVAAAYALGTGEQLLEFGFQRVFIILGMKLGNLLIVWLLCCLIKKLKKRCRFWDMNIFPVIIGMVLGCAGSYYWLSGTEALVNLHLNPLQMTVGIVCIWLIASGYVLYRLRETKRERAYVLRQNEMLERNYITAKESYESNAKLYHDMRNHFAMLQGYLKEENVTEAKAYLESLNGSQAFCSAASHTGLGAIDYILEQKKEKAETLGIGMDIHAEYPKECKIDPVDLCTILTNLLDNAIEACMKQPGERNEIFM